MAQGPTDFHYDVLPSLPEEDEGCPQPPLGTETVEWDAIPNLDDFFSRIYKYYEEKGFAVIVVSRILNVLALAFTIAFSAFLLLFVKWRALHSECIVRDTCDISEVAFEYNPLKDGLTLWNTLRVIYLAIFVVFWLWTLYHLFVDVREAAYIKHFTQHRLGLSPRQLRTVTWPEVARRIVDVQKQLRLHLKVELTEKDVVSRIMRKENYLIGMLNKGVLALNVSVPGLGKRFMLTRTLEWNLYWCILDPMLGPDFHIKEEFKHDIARLQRRFRLMAVVNLLLAPFVLVFLLIYFFMRNAEKFYHQPSSAGSRRWSSLAAWRLREFNELPHYLNHRLLASQRAAEKYIGQFPMPVLSHVAKFVAFLTGSFAALLLFVALIDDDLLERHLFSRNLVWWAATLGIVLAISRGFIAEQGVAFEPELALLEVVAHTHWLPRHWRGRGHTREVQEQFQKLFQFKALLFLEEMASIVMTPFVLYFSLPQCAPAIVAFLHDFTARTDGVGDICSMAAFDLTRHGNAKYGSPSQANKASRSRQGKMEKSLLSFAATYPTWEPDAAAKQMLMALGQAPPLRGAPGASADMATMQSAITASLFPGAPRNPAYHNISPYSVAAAGSVQRLAMRTCPGLAPVNGSLFASTDIINGSQSMGLGLAGADPEERVTTGQLLLQSFYEDQDRAMRLGGLHHSSLSGDMKPLQTSLPGRRDSRAALHLQDGHFYAPLQPPDLSTQGGGWSVGSAGALLGMRGRSSSGREASPSSEMAVLKQAGATHFGSSGTQGRGFAGRPASPAGQLPPSGAAEDLEAGMMGAGAQGYHVAPDSAHSSSTGSRSVAGSWTKGPGSFSGHSSGQGTGSGQGTSSGQMSHLPASGRAGSSQRSGEGPGLSRLQSSSGLHSPQGMHAAPAALPSRDGSGPSQPGSAAGLHSGSGTASGELFSSGGLTEGPPQQHPLQGHWGLADAPAAEDGHSYPLQGSYAPSGSNRSEVSAHESDDAPFAGEDSHVISVEWGQAPDRSFHAHGSDLLPHHFGQGQPPGSNPGDSLHGRGFKNLPKLGSSALFPQALDMNTASQDGQQEEHLLRGAEMSSDPAHEDAEHLHRGHADNRAAGASMQVPDFSDSAGWYEGEHTDEE